MHFGNDNLHVWQALWGWFMNVGGEWKGKKKTGEILGRRHNGDP
jgi:hypothetical protein